VPDPRGPELWWLLRTWREASGFDVQKVAEDLSVRLSDLNYAVSEEAIWSWERHPGQDRPAHGRRSRSGEREPRHEEAVLSALDDLYATRGALPAFA